MRLRVCVPAILVASSALHAQATWPTATPQSVGVRAAVLDSIDAEIASGRYGYVDRMVVIRRGKLVYDRSYKQDYDRAYADSVDVKGALNAHDPTGAYNYYNAWWHPFYRRGDLHTLQSVTKTITSVIIGVAVARGDFPGIDTPVLTFFDESKVANVDDRKRRMTVKHLITMTSGIDWNESLPYTDPRNTAIALEESSDWVKFTIDRPMAREPGAVFNYNSGATELLAHIFRRATGVDIEEYAARHLFAPLGITRWFWKRIPTGLIDTEGGLYLEARDLAKIWYLFLENGAWEGKRLVTPEWVTLSVSPIVATNPNPAAPRYGLAWWLAPDPRDAAKWVWYGSGFGGQFPIAFPGDDMVVVFNAWNILPGRGGLPLRPVLARLVKALQ
jgi:CubicO group peptidase (beta-lactamase class C family)